MIGFTIKSISVNGIVALFILWVLINYTITLIYHGYIINVQKKKGKRYALKKLLKFNNHPFDDAGIGEERPKIFSLLDVLSKVVLLPTSVLLQVEQKLVEGFLQDFLKNDEEWKKINQESKIVLDFSSKNKKSQKDKTEKNDNSKDKSGKKD